MLEEKEKGQIRWCAFGESLKDLPEAIEEHLEHVFFHRSKRNNCLVNLNEITK